MPGPALSPNGIPVSRGRRLDQLFFCCRSARPWPTLRFLKRTDYSPVQIYLPIADLPVNVFVILTMGLAVGFISGMFGIGGGFLMTPFFIFIGVTPRVAGGGGGNHIAFSSFSRAHFFLRGQSPRP